MGYIKKSIKLPLEFFPAFTPFNSMTTSIIITLLLPNIAI